jgi:SAM-dependent methyltransferase
MSGHSVAYHQVLLILNSEIRSRPRAAHVRILDLGCGDGKLLAFLNVKLKQYNPGVRIDLYGFDVADGGVQSDGYLDRALKHLAETFPDQAWNSRISLIRSGERWPYEDGFFDYIFSNHVLEHVMDHTHVFSEMARVLARDGRSAHLFPLEHYWIEGHLHLPFVHWIRNHDLRFAYIKAASILGLGKFRAHRNSNDGYTLDNYAAEHADYINALTNYVTKDALLGLAKRAGFRCSFKYTEWFYINKLRSLLGLQARHHAASQRTGVWHALLMPLLMRASSVTAFFEKEQSYRRR